MTAGSIFGKYEVVRRLAAGGMGEIYLGRQVGMAGFERLVIMKTLLPQLSEDPEMVAGFLDEARIVGSISHPNVVAMFEVGEHDGQLIMVMEHIHGLDIPQLRRAGANASKLVPPRVSAEIIRQAALGVDAAHHARDARGVELRIVHRDISPSNIMVRADGNVKVLDFGVARSERKQSKTVHGQLKGKVPYMSPEQIRSMPVDARHDQWSLGVVFWEMLAQRRLFKGDDMPALFKMILTSAIVPPSSLQPEVPGALDAVVLRLLQREPTNRFASMSEAALALRAALDELKAPSDEVPRYLKEVAGERLAQDLERLLTAGPAGLQPTLHRKTCERCGHEQAPSNRFCSSCGASMGGSRSESRPPSSTPARAAVAAAAPAQVALPALEVHDTLEVAELPPDDAIASEEVAGTEEMASTTKLAPVPPTRPDGFPSPPQTDATAPMPRARRPVTVAFARLVSDRIRPEAVAALKLLAESHGGKVSVLDGGRQVAAFEDDDTTPSGADRALAFALDAARALAPFGAAARIAVCHGTAARGALGWNGQVVDDAEVLAAAVDEPGVVVAREVPTSRRLSRGRRVSGEAEAVEIVGGPSSKPEASLVGRDDVLSQIATLVVDADRGVGGVAVLSGAPGIGKSALLNEAGALIAWKGMLTARGSASLRAAAPPLDVVRQLARSLLLQMASEVREAPGLPNLDTGLAATGFGPVEQARLRQLFTTDPIAEPTPLAQRAAALRGSLARLFVFAARRYGLGLLIDDAHLLDSASRSFLDALAPRLREERALVVMAMNPQHGAAPFAGVRALRVAPLGDEAIVSLAEDFCGPLETEVAALVRAEAAGNPRAALCAAGLLAADQAMVWSGERWSVGPRAARRRAATVEAVLHKLSAPSRAQLASVAVAGGALHDDPALLAAIDEAAALWLVPKRSLGRPPPLSPTLQRALVEEAQRSGPAVLRELHDAAAARAETQLQDDPAALDQLAYHRRRGTGSAQAADALLQALSRCAALGVVEPLLELGPQLCAAFAGGQVATGAGHRGLALDAVAAVLEAQLGLDPGAVLAQADAVLAALPRTHKSAGMARVLRMRAHALAGSGHTDAAISPLMSAVAMANGVDAPSVAAIALVELGRAAEASGELDAAHTAYADATALAPESGAGEEAATWTAPLGSAVLYARRGKMEEARSAIAAASERAEGRPWGESAVCSARAMMPDATSEQALHHAEDAVTAADRAGDVVLQLAARHTLARGRAALGKAAEAKETLREGEALAEDALYPSGRDASRLALTKLEAGPR